MRDNAFWADFVSFIVLIASTAAGLILFMGDEYSTICAIIAASITALNAFSKYLDFSGKAELHALSMKDFGGIQRDLLTMLMATPYAEAKRNLGDLNNRFNEAATIMPPINPADLLGVVGEDGEPMFKLIIDGALLREAHSDLMGHIGNHNLDRLMCISVLDDPDEHAFALSQMTNEERSRESLLNHISTSFRSSVQTEVEYI